MFELLRLDYFVWIENLCSCEIGFMKLDWKKEYIIGYILYCLITKLV